MQCNVSACSLNTADQKASIVPITVNYDAHFYTAHKKERILGFSQLYVQCCALERPPLSPEDAPLAPRRQRCLPAAEAAGSLFGFPQSTRSLFHVRTFWLPVDFTDGGGTTLLLSGGLVGFVALRCYAEEMRLLPEHTSTRPRFRPR